MSLDTPDAITHLWLDAGATRHFVAIATTWAPLAPHSCHGNCPRPRTAGLENIHVIALRTRSDSKASPTSQLSQFEMVDLAPSGTHPGHGEAPIHGRYDSGRFPRGNGLSPATAWPPRGEWAMNPAPGLRDPGLGRRQS